MGRTHLFKELSVSREDRDLNITRIGFVAAEISRHGGDVICAAVSPYAATRNSVTGFVKEDDASGLAKAYFASDCIVK